MIYLIIPVILVILFLVWKQVSFTRNNEPYNNTSYFDDDGILASDDD